MSYSQLVDLLNKMRNRLNEMSDDDPKKAEFKEVVDLFEKEYEEQRNETIDNSQQKSIEIDEPLLKDAVDIWWEGK